MNIYLARDMVISLEKLVISKKEFGNIIDCSLPIARVYANRMKKKGLLSILRGKLIFTNNEFVIANQLVEPSYISVHSALFLNNKIQQVPKKIECVNPKNTITEKNFLYYKINPKLFFGFEKKRIVGTWVFVATPEKAIIDGLYLKRISEELAKEILPKLNKKQLEEYLLQLKESKVKGTKRVIKFFKELI
jgi:predicted transcriptional regulator of viral defense system